MIPHAYRVLLGDRRTRRLLSGLGISSLGDGMSTGLLLIRIAPGWLRTFDAASFASEAHRPGAHTPLPRRAASRSTRRVRPPPPPRLLGLIALTWLFFFLYGLVEDALPVS